MARYAPGASVSISSVITLHGTNPEMMGAPTTGDFRLEPALAFANGTSITGETMEIHAAMTINAAGAWAGQIAQMAGIEVVILPSKGTMVAVNHRIAFFGSHVFSGFLNRVETQPAED